MILNVHEWGDGEPLICLHGVTGHGERFKKLATERLPHRRVIALDLRGHGRSGYEPPWSVDQQRSDVIETAESLGLERADWLGFSFGGRIMAELALTDPDRIRKLILLDPALRIPAEYALESAEDERTIKTFADADEAIEARYANGSLISTPRELLVDEMDQHLTAAPDGRLMQRYSRGAAIVAWSEMASEPPPPAGVPTLFLTGNESPIRNAKQIERYRAMLGDGLTQVEVTAGHSVLWDAFDQTATAVADFL